MIDPIVDEVRGFRAEHARKFNFNLHAICADIRQFEASCGHEVVELLPKRLARHMASGKAELLDQQIIRA